MDAIRTLLLACTQIVVLDPDRVSGAATRPTRSGDVEKFEDELAQLGFVMSLDLATTIRRLPHQAIQELRTWILDTLTKTLGPERPQVPLTSTGELYRRRMLTWLSTQPQPCPWCAQLTQVVALDPCGHLVCTSCWAGGNFAGCPICHRRVVLTPPSSDATERVARHDGRLRLLHLAFDVAAIATHRFESLLARTTPLSSDERTEVEALIDGLGPKAARWIPATIPNPESRAIAVARLWVVAADRRAMCRATSDHLRTATDVLRVAVVLMGGPPSLEPPFRLRSIPRSLRTVVLAALDQLAPEVLLEDVRRHVGLWKRIGEQLHPSEHVTRWPTAARAFAAVRGKARASSWNSGVEAGLHAGDVRTVTERLAERPAELLRRINHLLRVTHARQPEALGAVLEAIRVAIPHGTAPLLLTIAKHVANASVVDSVRGELVTRAARRRNFARAVIDRELLATHPRLWEVACVHAAARANIVYVRDRDGSVVQFRRRDGETTVSRLMRLLGNTHDGVLATVPAVNAPTWFALTRDDFAMPSGSEGWVVDVTMTSGSGIRRLTAPQLIDQLAPSTPRDP